MDEIFYASATRSKRKLSNAKYRLQHKLRRITDADLPMSQGETPDANVDISTFQILIAAVEENLTQSKQTNNNLQMLSSVVADHLESTIQSSNKEAINSEIAEEIQFTTVKVIAKRQINLRTVPRVY